MADSSERGGRDPGFDADEPLSGGHRYRPPRLASLFLQITLPDELRGPVVGDLEERFQKEFARLGPRRAALWFWKQTLRTRPWALRRALADAERERAGSSNREGLIWAVAQDTRFALRGLRLRPGASAVIVATLAVAVGSTTAIFSVVNGVLLRPLPYPESDRLVRVWQTNESWFDSPIAQMRAFASHFPVSMPTFNDWADTNRGFSDIGAYAGGDFRYQGTEYTEVLHGQEVTSGVFRALGVPPLMGRTFLPREDEIGSDPVAVISHGFWKSRFGGSEALGQTLHLDGLTYTVVGVMPAGFSFPSSGNDLWASFSDIRKESGRNSNGLSVIGRLGPAVTLEAVSNEMAAIQDGLEEAYPDDQGGGGSTVEFLLDSVVGDIRATLLFLLGAVALVLVIASANIANLLYVLGLARRKELAVRAALGADGTRLARGLLVESGLLASLGGAAGILIAWTTLPSLVGLLPPGVPRRSEIALDPWVLVFGLGVTMLTALLVGVLPALQASRTQPTLMLNDSVRGLAGGRRGARIRALLVLGEVALAFVLLVGAGLLGNSYTRLVSVQRGFDAEGIATMVLAPPSSPDGEEVVRPASFVTDDAARDARTRELRERFAAIPGVLGASLTNQIPMSGSTSSTSYFLERPDAEPEEVGVYISVVGDNYLDVMDIPVVRGRSFEPTDVRGAAGVALVNEAMAEAHWPGQSPIGKRLRNNNDDEDPWLTIVGVAGNVRHEGLGQDVDPKLYVPVWQSKRSAQQWVMRTKGDPGAVLSLARDAVRELSPGTSIRRSNELEAVISRTVAVPRFRTVLMVSLAGVAALLALLGIYGVVTFTVSQRTREIGVRIALGAHPTRLVRQTLTSGLELAAGGVFLGLLVALPATRLLTSFLFGVEPTDPATFIVIALLVTGVGAAAAYVPARRAAAVDPVSVLNTD